MLFSPQKIRLHISTFSSFFYFEKNWFAVMPFALSLPLLFFLPLIRWGGEKGGEKHGHGHVDTFFTYVSYRETGKY